MNFKSFFGLWQSGSEPTNMAGRRKASDTPPPADPPATTKSPGATGGASLGTHELTKAEKAELAVTVVPPPEPPPPANEVEAKFLAPPYTQAKVHNVRFGPNTVTQHVVPFRVSTGFIRSIVQRMPEPPMSREEFADYQEIHARTKASYAALEHVTEKAARRVYEDQLRRFSAGDDFSKEHVQSSDVFELDEIRLDFRRRHNELLKATDRICKEGALLRERIARRIHRPIVEMAFELDAQERALAQQWDCDFWPSGVARTAAFCATRHPFTLFNHFNSPTEKDGIYELARQLGYWTPEPPPVAESDPSQAINPDEQKEAS